MLLCCNSGLFLGLLLYSIGLFVNTMSLSHCLHYFASLLCHDIVSFIYLWNLLKCVISFLCTVFSAYRKNTISHISFCFLLFLTKSLFSRSFCLTMCTSNPFLLISAPYSNYQVNSNLLYHTSTTLYSFWSLRKFLLNACYMPGTITCVEDKALLNLFYF